LIVSSQLRPKRIHLKKKLRSNKNNIKNNINTSSIKNFIIQVINE